MLIAHGNLVMPFECFNYLYS